MITTTIYDEDVEWVFSGAASFNAADNSNPHTGLIDLRATTSASADAGSFKSPVVLNSSLFVSLSIWIERTGIWSATTSGVGFWWTDSAGNQVGNVVTIKDGAYGFSIASAVYQNVVIPMADFGVPAGTQIQFLAFNTVTKTNLSYFLDTIVLTSMSVSCDPSNLANAARCFSQCHGDDMAVKSLLLSQFVPCTPSGGGAPIIGCNAPGVPTNLVASNVTSSGFTVTWQQPAGTSVSSYTIIWSQFALLFTPAKRSGAAMVSGSTLSYAITGLQPSTTYYVEVIAYNGLCQSNASVVISQTTLSASNGLLNSLVHYWDFNSLAGNKVTDLVGALDPIGLNGGADLSIVPGKIGNGVNITGAGGLNGLLQSGPIPLDMMAASAVSSITYQVWFNLASAALNHAVFGVWTTTNSQKFTFVECHPDQTVLLGYYNDGVGTRTTLSTPAVVLNTWNHLVYGYDGANSVFWFQLNGAARVTTPMNTINGQNNSSSVSFGVLSGAGEEFAGIMDEYGVWTKALSTTDVANLYNSGSGLPFGSFTT